MKLNKINLDKNAIKLKIGQNSISSPTLSVDGNQSVKSKYNQIIDTSGVENLFDDSRLVDLSNYYTKNETYSQYQTNSFLDGKLDKGGYEDTAQDLKNEIDGVSANVNYRVEILSSNGNAFRNDNISTTLIAKVYHGANDITSTVPQGNFTWKRVSDDNEADNAWNLLYANFHSNTLVIDSDDVAGRATFNCEVFINN